MLLGPGVTAATTAKRRNATTCSVGVRYLLQIGMRLNKARSGGEGLERSCGTGDWVRGRGPACGVELLRAWFGGRAYARHRHDTYAIGVTEVPKKARALYPTREEWLGMAE